MIGNILEWLENDARRTPERVAFFDDREQWTYARLLDAARAVGSHLGAMIPPRRPVAVLMDPRAIRCIPAFLGIVYAGCPYSPLNTTLPGPMLARLLEQLDPALILADDKGRKALAGQAVSAPVIDIGDALGAAADDALLARIRLQATSMDPLSILYTSGSTGLPKSSVQMHLSYILWTRAIIDRYGLTADTVFCNQAPFYYANSVLELFAPLVLGATVYLLPAWALTFPKKLIECLNERHITELSMTPSSYIHMVNSGALSDGCLPELRWGILSGEAMPWEPLREWMRAAPNADWWHFYGSTEMFCVASGLVDRDRPPDGPLSVGYPFPMTHVLIVDAQGREAAPGEPGEIYVSSPWVSRGYYRDFPHSAAAWVDDPLGQGYPERFFRSGDLGYLTPDGRLVVLGRKDNQIKHFSYRMELADVDAALRAVPGIRECCVLYEKESGRIFCFYAGGLDE